MFGFFHKNSAKNLISRALDDLVPAAKSAHHIGKDEIHSEMVRDIGDLEEIRKIIDEKRPEAINRLKDVISDLKKCRESWGEPLTREYTKTPQHRLDVIIERLKEALEELEKRKKSK